MRALRRNGASTTPYRARGLSTCQQREWERHLVRAASVRSGTEAQRQAADERGEQHQEPGRTSALRRNTRCIRVRQHNARRGRPRGRGRRGGRWLVSVREGLEVGDDRGFIGRAEAEVSELDG